MELTTISVPFGGVNEIAYSKERKMIAIGTVNPSDFSDVLLEIAEVYKKDGRKISGKIYNLATELAKLYKRDCKVRLETQSLISNTESIEMRTKRV